MLQVVKSTDPPIYNGNSLSSDFIFVNLDFSRLRAHISTFKISPSLFIDELINKSINNTKR